MTTLLLSALVLSPVRWQPVTVSFYTYGRRTSDGTRMDINGRWVATRAFPLGSVVEIRYKGRVLRLPVRDKTAPRFRNRADLPKGTWALLGAPFSRGLLRGEWRRVR